MNISELVSTPKRERLLQQLLMESRPSTLLDLARRARVSPPQAHKYMAILKKNGLVQQGHLRDTPVLRALRLSENLVFLGKIGLVTQIRLLVPEIRGIGIFGSWAQGSNDERADVDLWIFTSKEIGDLAVGKLRRALETKLGRKIDLAFVNIAKLGELKVKNPTFYYALYHSIRLWGETPW